MRRIALLLAVLLLSSCATLGPSFRVEVSSLADTQVSVGKTFILLPGLGGVAPEDLQFREYAGYIRGALVRRGYSESTDPEAAAMAVFLSYGIGDPNKQTYTRSVPVYGQTGGGTATVNLSTFGSGGGWTNTTGTVAVPTTYGQVGTETHTESTTTYFRYMFVDAYDLAAFRATKTLVPVWRSVVTSTGSSGDLRQVLPILVAASEPYLGLSTTKQMHIDLTEGDARVGAVKAGAKRLSN